jgi:hypothetical protein
LQAREIISSYPEEFLSGYQMGVRDEQGIRSLAIGVASLTKRQQRWRGLRMA